MTAKAKVPALLRRSEHDEQRDLFAWMEVAQAQHSELRLAFAIPNFSGRLGNAPPIAAIRQAQKLKAEGRKVGVPDLMLPVACGVYHGLFIEMKRADGTPSAVGPEQAEWHQALILQGYRVYVCYGFEQARDAVLGYLASGLPYTVTTT